MCVVEGGVPLGTCTVTHPTGMSVPTLPGSAPGAGVKSSEQNRDSYSQGLYI